MKDDERPLSKKCSNGTRKIKPLAVKAISVLHELKLFATYRSERRVSPREQNELVSTGKQSPWEENSDYKPEHEGYFISKRQVVQR